MTLKTNWSNWSVRAKLRGMVLLLALAMVLVGVVAALALARTQTVTAVVVRQTAALSLLQAADMSHDGLRSVVMPRTFFSTSAGSSRMRMALP